MENFMLVALGLIALVISGEALPKDDRSSENSLEEAHVSFTYGGEIFEETIIAHAATSVVTYRIQQGEANGTVVDDYLKNLRAIRHPDEDFCILSPFTPHSLLEDGVEFAQWATDEEREMEEETAVYVVYKASPALRDTDFMSQEARDACRDVPVYWGHLVENHVEPTEKRVKRQLSGSVTRNFPGGSVSVGGATGPGGPSVRGSVTRNWGRNSATLGGSYSRSGSSASGSYTRSFPGGSASVSGSVGPRGSWSVGVRVGIRFRH